MNCLNEEGYGSLHLWELYLCVQGFKRQGFECFDNLFRKKTQWFQIIWKETAKTGCFLWNLETCLTGEALPLISQWSFQNLAVITLLNVLDNSEKLYFCLVVQWEAASVCRSKPARDQVRRGIWCMEFTDVLMLVVNGNKELSVSILFPCRWHFNKYIFGKIRRRVIFSSALVG